MSQQLRQVLSRWEINPPVIGAEEASGDLREVFDALRRLGAVRQTASAGAANCTECGERCRVTYIADTDGKQHGHIHCRECGIIAVPASALERWEINTCGLLTAALGGVNLSLQERVAGQLWQVGKANWSGRSRDVWFARAYRRSAVAAAVEQLKRWPKAVVFAPTEAGAGRWRDAGGNLVIALESALSFSAGGILLDVEYVEGRIVDAGMGPDSTAPRRPKKRGERAANIEKLEKEMIQHLRAARDHAHATQDQTGEPKLLPRPTQKELGERVSLSESDVSRCLNDETARELKLYWAAAADIHQVMAWSGPVSTGRQN